MLAELHNLFLRLGPSECIMSTLMSTEHKCVCEAMLDP